MSLRLEMLQVARLAPNLLGDAGDRVVEFLHGQISEDGGARDRFGKSDLYYTVFALEGFIALRVDPPVDRVMAYLRGFGAGDGLDLVHLTCLVRCWAAMPRETPDATTVSGILQRIESYRSPDGGYGARQDAESSTAYHGFLALGAYQDLLRELPDVDALRGALRGLRSADGAFANQPGRSVGTTSATAAAVTIMRHLNLPVPEAVGDWLLARLAREGGFLAAPEAPLPDLLSTATALHALSGLHIPFNGFKESCLDFIDTLWTGRAFCGHWADDAPDCEYTYYALLALGHLSL